MDLREYYSRKEVQKELLRLSAGREVQAWFGEIRGKRPEIVNFEGDIKDLVKQGMTSFHVSEERWKDPLILESGLTKKQLDEQRVGWDCILDLDSKNLEFSMMTGELLIDALKFNDIKNYSLKFSGNHGYHIGIPFEAFPKEVNNVNIKNYFPDGVRVISEYLKDMIKEFLTAKILSKYKAEDAAKSVGKNVKDITEKICKKCGIQANESLESKCNNRNCLTSFSGKADFCPQCKLKDISIKTIIICPSCKVSDINNFNDGKFVPFKVVDIDSVLISSRHLFRCSYSVNEKSGFVSIPIKNLKEFNIEDAKIENVKVNLKFLDTESAVKDEAKNLLIQAFDWAKKTKFIDETKLEKNFEVPKVAIKSDYFPPCVLKLMSGVKDDGRKRAIFVLVNFLQNMGWSLDDIEKFLIEWNKKNYEPLREGYLKAQVSWFRRQNKIVPPPNCENPSYYKTMGVKCEDNICNICKNPVNYVFRRLRNKPGKNL